MLAAGSLLVEGCMRPWSERLLDLVGPRRGEACLDLCSESGVVARMLAGAVGPDGRVDSVIEPGQLTTPARPWTVVVSLFGLAGQVDVGGWLRLIAARIPIRAGGLAAAVWAGSQGAPHEAAVQAGLIGAGLTWPRQADEFSIDDPRRLDPLPPGWVVTRLRDVVRFDGIAHLWAALVDERGAPDRILEAPSGVLADAQRVCARRLSAHTAADGTLRIPVEALVLQRPG